MRLNVLRRSSSRYFQFFAVRKRFASCSAKSKHLQEQLWKVTRGVTRTNCNHKRGLPARGIMLGRVALAVCKLQRLPWPDAEGVTIQVLNGRSPCVDGSFLWNRGMTWGSAVAYGSYPRQEACGVSMGFQGRGRKEHPGHGP